MFFLPKKKAVDVLLLHHCTCHPKLLLGLLLSEYLGGLEQGLIASVALLDILDGGGFDKVWVIGNWELQEES